MSALDFNLRSDTNESRLSAMVCGFGDAIWPDACLNPAMALGILADQN
jgi:hypothetical protein